MILNRLIDVSSLRRHTGISNAKTVLIFATAQ